MVAAVNAKLIDSGGRAEDVSLPLKQLDGMAVSRQLNGCADSKGAASDYGNPATQCPVHAVVSSNSVDGPETRHDECVAATARATH
jgi:hypothetical protein